MQDIRSLLDAMTLDEKIGQLIQCTASEFVDTDAAATGPVTENGIPKSMLPFVGSVLNFGSTAEAIAIQKAHLEHSRIPLLLMMDVIHGYRTIYPIPLALGCSFDPSVVETCSKMAAKEAVAGGIHATFTPMVDLSRDARWGRVMEGCGEDVLLNCDMGAAQVKAFQGDDLTRHDTLAACVKHFAAYGGAEAGRDYNTVDISEHSLREYYLPAYKACIDAGVAMVMPSFNTLNGVPSVANPWLMQTVLKDEWGFDGVVISDYNAVGELLSHGLAENLKDAAALAFANGCDIEMCSAGYACHLKDLIKDGTVSEDVLDGAVLRVLELKNKLGLFEDPFRGAVADDNAPLYLCDEHRHIARTAAEESAVLLKNDGVLPLSKTLRRIALIGPFADSHDILGFWSCGGRSAESVTVKEGIAALCPDIPLTVANGEDIDEAIAVAKDADAVILCLGEPQNYSGEGNSRADLRLPGRQEALALAVTHNNRNTVCVTFSGRPLVMSAFVNDVPAVLHMWFPGSEGGNAVARLLFGDANPCGKLAMSFPKEVGQCPIYYNHLRTGRPAPADAETRHVPFTSNYIDCGNLPQFSFGHGLSYSRFVYESLTLSAERMTADDTIDVDIALYNDSDREGKETVMLFLRDAVASIARPVCRLIAYQKVTLAPHERRTVRFAVSEPMLRFWNAEQRFVSEAGRFELSTGYADHLLHTVSFSLE